MPISIPNYMQQVVLGYMLAAMNNPKAIINGLTYISLYKAKWIQLPCYLPVVI